MSWNDIRILYLREIRSALRERGVVVNSILIPLLLYPLLLWVMFSAVTFVRGQEEKFISRVLLVALPEAHEELREVLADDEQIELTEAPAGDFAAAVRSGTADAAAEFLPPEEGTGVLADNFRVRLTYDASKDRSDKARERFVAALDDYRSSWVHDEGERLGIDEATWEQLYVERKDVSTSEEKGALILGLLAPLLMIIMVAVGCFYPAVDATAGERERSTWETLMTVSASRSSILVAKYLYVATMATAAGLINLTAMTLLMGRIMAPLTGGGEDLSFAIPFQALPLMALALVLLALFLAAGMMIFASFARTFKEGQAMVTPFYLLVIFPPMLTQSPDLQLDLKLALIPIVNVTLLFREAIAGTYNWPLIGVTLAVELVAVVVALRTARRILEFEDFLIGSYSGSFGKFFKERLLGRGSSSPAVEESSDEQ